MGELFRTESRVGLDRQSLATISAGNAWRAVLFMVREGILFFSEFGIREFMSGMKSDEMSRQVETKP